MIVLIVDDYYASRYSFELYLNEIGITKIDKANNGKDALDKATKNNYNLILLDMGLPKIEGLDVAKAIRKLDDVKKSQTPIIGHSCSYKYKSIYHDLQMNDFFKKPVQFSEFRSIVLKYVGIK